MAAALLIGGFLHNAAKQHAGFSELFKLPAPNGVLLAGTAKSCRNGDDFQGSVVTKEADFGLNVLENMTAAQAIIIGCHADKIFEADFRQVIDVRSGRSIDPFH